MKICNMESTNGNPVPNQFILKGATNGQFYCGTDHASGDAFQSYDSMIAFRDFRGKVYLDRGKWDYSPTTSKYRNKFLGESTQETRCKIVSGEYKLVDMN